MCSRGLSQSPACKCGGGAATMSVQLGSSRPAHPPGKHAVAWHLSALDTRPPCPEGHMAYAAPLATPQARSADGSSGSRRPVTSTAGKGMLEMLQEQSKITHMQTEASGSFVFLPRSLAARCCPAPPTRQHSTQRTLP